MGVSTFRIQGYYPFRRASVKNLQECLRRRCGQIPYDRGTICRNWRIMQALMRLADYVFVHELVHLLYNGHGRDYSKEGGV